MSRRTVLARRNRLAKCREPDGALNMSTNSDKYRTAVAGFSSVVDSVKDWSATSPCDGWSASDLVGHVIGGLQVVSGTETGQEPERNDPSANVKGGAAEAFATARDAALGALNETNLGKMVESPMGPMPLDQMMGMFLTPDILIHTWDLAKSAGVNVTLDVQLVDETYNALLPLDEMIRQPGVFGPKIEPPAGADAQTKLVCFTGRTP
jgi:uncharacterized protein (TIGR03086 family)